MPDRRKHRGAAPGDDEIFGEACVPVLRSAVHDLSWLLSHGYADKSALKLVGDRYNLTTRQRQAVKRGSCGDRELVDRRRRERCAEELTSETSLCIDGYNVLTSVEAALAGGALFIGRDGCLRDVASMHGSFRKVEETEPAIHLIAESIRALSIDDVTWYLDQPVSNSGRLKVMLAEVAKSNGENWSIELVPDPDKVLINTPIAETRIKGMSTLSPHIVSTADSVILDAPNVQWFNLAHFVIARHVDNAWVIDLRME